jgi:hypothetical protein
MAQSFDGIISQLEQQKAAIDKALAALRDIGGTGGLVTGTPEPTSAPAARKGGMSPEGKQRLIAALKKRWAAKKRAAQIEAPASAPIETPPAPATRKGGGMTEDGRKRLAEAMKRRWGVKRAASAVKKRRRKKAA